MSRGKSVRNIEEPWWMPEYRTGKQLSGLATGIGAGYEKAKMYAGNKLDDTYTALTNLLKVADSDEGMKLYEKKLGEFTTDSHKFGGFDDNIVQAETLKVLGEQKGEMRRNFDASIKDASDFINTTQFLDTAGEFVNIQDTIDRLNKDLKVKGKTEHGSVADFLQSELANANKLRDGMVAGFQIDKGEIVGTNFRYNKAETNDKETFRKLNLYRDRLDLAVKSLAGDKMISPEEAEAIIIGDQAHYLKAKGDALRKAEYNYKANKSMVVKYDGLINTALQKMLSADDIFNMEGLDDAGKLEMGGNLTAGSWDKIVQQLTNKKGEYAELRNIANKNYKNWYGSYFETLEGGIRDEDIDWAEEKIESKEDLKKSVEALIGIDLPEKDVTPEQIAETKKTRRQIKGVFPVVEQEDKELYSSSEKILEGYIKGDVDADSLREIGGQSLANKASRIKDAYKGEYAGRKKYKGKPVSDIDTLKELKYGLPGDRYSWHDVVSSIYGKKGRGLSVVDGYLSGDVGIKDFKLTYRTRRNRAEEIKQKFQKLGVSLEEFKKKYSKDYKTLINLLGKSKAK